MVNRSNSERLRGFDVRQTNGLTDICDSRVAFATENIFLIFKEKLCITRTKLAINGGWSEWSDWSSCQSNCRKSRTRKCNNPSPLFGGANCTGDDYGESPGTCYGGTCCPGLKISGKKKVNMLLFLDTSDYIGCYGRNSKGVYSDKLTTSSYATTMTNCYCVGYCASKGYALAGIYK